MLVLPASYSIIFQLFLQLILPTMPVVVRPTDPVDWYIIIMFSTQYFDWYIIIMFSTQYFDWYIIIMFSTQYEEIIQ